MRQGSHINAFQIWATGLRKTGFEVLPSSVSLSESESQLREEGKAEDLNFLCALLPGSPPGWWPSVSSGPLSLVRPHEYLADIWPCLTSGEHEDWKERGHGQVVGQRALAMRSGASITCKVQLRKEGLPGVCAALEGGGP